MEQNAGREAGTQTEGMNGETEVQGNQKEQKLFTQEDVNSFIQSRMSKIKAQAQKEAQAEYDQKLADIRFREMKLLVKETLDARGMSPKLAEIITCTDKEDLKTKLDFLQEIYGNNATQKEKVQTGGFRIGVTTTSEGQHSFVDPVRRAMGLDRKE